MNTDLLTRLQYLDPAPPGSTLPDVVMDEEGILNEIRRTTTAREPQRPTVGRRWFVAVAAAILVTVLVGGLAWIFQARSGVDPADRTPATSTVPPPTTPAAPAMSIEWTSVDLPASVTIVTDGSRFFGLAEDGSQIAVFRSDDGARWQRIATANVSNFDPRMAERQQSAHAWAGTLAFYGFNESLPEPTIDVAVVDADGAVVESTIALPVAEAHRPFVEGYGNVLIRSVDGGGFVVIGEYSLSHDRVIRAGLEGTGMTLGEFEGDGDVSFGDTTISSDSVVVDLTALGLHGDDLNHPNRFQLMSDTGAEWDQVETAFSFSQLTVVDGGLVGNEAGDNRLLFSADGIAWSELPSPRLRTESFDMLAWKSGALLFLGDPPVRPPPDQQATLLTELHLVSNGAIVEIDISHTELATVNRDILEATDAGTLTAGNAGLAYLTGFTEGDGEKEAYTPTDIAVSTDGTTWVRVPLPESVGGRSLSLFIGSETLILTNEDGQAWVGDIR